MNNTKNTKN